MKEERNYTADDFADGKLLELAVITFKQRHNEESLEELLQVLRDTPLIVPCKEIISEDAINPQLLENGGQFFFPVFSNLEALGEEANHMPTVTRDILEVIELANQEEQEVTGIVLNAFGDVFVMNRELMEIISTFETRL